MSAQEFKAQGNKAFVEKNYEQAIDFYSKAIELDQSDVSFFSNRSGAYMNIGQYENALKDADQCLSLNTNFIKGYTRKGLALEKLGNQDEAKKVYEEGLQKDSNNQELKDGLERCENTQPQFDINSLLQNPMIAELIQKNPQLAQQLFSNPELLKNPQMMQTMMNLFAQQKQPQQPSQQQENEPQSQFNPEPHFQEHQTQQENTQQHQSQKKKEEPKQEMTQYEKLKKMADSLYVQKKFDEAIEQYQKCIDSYPTNLIPRSNMAICYVEKKEYEKAHEILDEAIKIYNECEFDKRSFEEYAKILEKKARVYELEMKMDLAIETLEKSLLENQVGRVSAKLREIKRKKKRLEEEAYLNPELSEQHRNKGNEYFKEQKYPEAIIEYEEAQKRNPKDPRVYNNLCSSFMRIMQYGEAKKMAEKVLEMEPQNIKAMIKKAQIHSFFKEFHKATEIYQKVLEINPSCEEAQNGLRDTQIKIQTNMHTGNDEERVQRAMADPEIQSIMMDPMIRIALEQMQKSPQTAMEYMQDKTLGPKIQKLIQAGVLKVA